MNAVLLWFVQLAVGALAGTLFPQLDRIVSRYLMEKQEVHLVHRSFLFLAALMAMDIFQITSSLSTMGFGALLGLQVGILVKMLPVWTNPEALRRDFFWDLAKSAPYESLRWFCVGFGLLTIGVLVRTISLLPR